VAFIPDREKKKLLQGEVRECLRTVVNEHAGQWITAKSLMDFVYVRYHHVESYLRLKSVMEHLKTINLRTEKIRTVYQCDVRVPEERSYWQSKMEKEFTSLLYQLISKHKGEWMTAGEIANIMNGKYPFLGEMNTTQVVTQYLMAMRLETKFIPTILYFCENQYFPY